MSTTFPVADLVEAIADLLPPTLADLMAAVGDQEPTPKLLAREIVADGVCGVPGDPGLVDDFERYRRDVVIEYREAAAAIDALGRWTDEPGHEPSCDDARRILAATKQVKHAGTIAQALFDLDYATVCEVAEADARAAAAKYEAAARRTTGPVCSRLLDRAEEARERARGFAALAARTTS